MGCSFHLCKPQRGPGWFLLTSPRHPPDTQASLPAALLEPRGLAVRSFLQLPSPLPPAAPWAHPSRLGTCPGQHRLQESEERGNKSQPVLPTGSPARWPRLGPPADVPEWAPGLLRDRRGERGAAGRPGPPSRPAPESQAPVGAEAAPTSARTRALPALGCARPLGCRRAASRPVRRAGCSGGGRRGGDGSALWGGGR